MKNLSLLMLLCLMLAVSSKKIAAQETNWQEKRNAKDYLTLGNLNIDVKGFLPDSSKRYVMNGAIHNAANTTSYTDIKVRFDWLSQTEQHISSDNYTCHDTVKPGETIKVSMPVIAPKDMQHVNVNIFWALPIN